MCVDIDECLHRLASKETRKYAVAVSRKWVERSQLFAANKIYCFNKADNIQNYSISLHVRKDFLYIGKVNEIIRHALEAGLIQKWDNDGQTLKFNDDLNEFHPNSNSQLNDMIVFAVGLSVVALAVSVELIVNNRLEALNRYNLTIFVHKVFRARWASVYSLR